MQRAPCSWSSAIGRSSWNSRKSCTRSAIGRLGAPTRWILRKPPSSPTVREHLLLAGGLGLGLGRLVGSGSSRGITCPRGSRRGVLVLSGLADVAGLLEAVALRRVHARLTGSNRTRAVAIAVLGDHSGHPCL